MVDSQGPNRGSNCCSPGNNPQLGAPRVRIVGIRVPAKISRALWPDDRTKVVSLIIPDSD